MCEAVVDASPAIVGASERCSASCVDGSHYADHEIKLKAHAKRGVVEDDHNDFYLNVPTGTHIIIDVVRVAKPRVKCSVLNSKL